MTIDNLFRILLTKKPSIYIINNENAIFNLIPELEKCKGFNQKNEWHIYDVYDHILHVVDNVPTDIILRLAALFHDIGKPFTYREDDNHIGHFYGHWEKSKEIFDKFSKQNNIDEELSSLVSNLIYYHDVNLGKITNERLKELCDVFNDKQIKMLFKLKKADLLSQNKKYHYLLRDYKEQEKKLLLKCDKKDDM